MPSFKLLYKTYYQIRLNPQNSNKYNFINVFGTTDNDLAIGLHTQNPTSHSTNLQLMATISLGQKTQTFTAPKYSNTGDLL